ncbi:50S ribosomal protein L22 [Anaerolineaceae bacterium oral taxon 439]|nr:50S ribosomal protein L22 [Anaerolineaceae bacterium oral taxon 439]
MSQEVKAKLSNLGVSAQKVRLVINMVRGKKVTDALNILRFTNKVSAEPVYKLIASAAANAEENFGLDRNDLIVRAIYADEGATRKWRYFGARGRFKPVLRRSSHITVVLSERA